MKSWWMSRPARDRAILAALAACGAAVLFVALVALPLERARARLARELPALRGSLASLQADAAEAKRLRALPAAVPVATAPLASLATNAGGLPGASIAVIDERHVRVSGADIAFASLLEWLGNAQATHAMRVESARLDALPAAGRVRAELVLARR
jgi:type II secretory pathway component PulM